MIEEKLFTDKYSCPKHKKDVIVSGKRTVNPKIELNFITEFQCNSERECEINNDWTKCPYPNLKLKR